MALTAALIDVSGVIAAGNSKTRRHKEPRTTQGSSEDRRDANVTFSFGNEGDAFTKDEAAGQFLTRDANEATAQAPASWSSNRDVQIGRY